MLTAITETVPVAPGIRHITMVPPPGEVLASFVPGSHVLVRCGDERYNAYSLTGECRSPRSYSISVLLQNNGSAWIHERRVGDTVDISAPRSTFAPVLSARRHVLIAGGIGVTPILSHARENGASAEVLYVHRPGAGTHVADLRAVCEDVNVLTDRSSFVAALRDCLRRQPLGTHLYVCGPTGLIDVVMAEASDAGWPRSRCHRERFAAAASPRRPFDIQLRRGTTVHVPAELSALDALARAGIAVPHLCRHGVCGRCRTTVTRGEIDHRDVYLTDDERAEGDSMMVCVSRACDVELEVDL